MKRRTRKTLEQPVAVKIRAYAAGYAAGGQKEHAQGMLQAADIVDKLLGGTGAMPLGAALGASEIEARVARLETAVFPNGSYEIGKMGPSSIAFAVRPAREKPPPKAITPLLTAPALQITPQGDVALVPGEECILAAIVQHGPPTGRLSGVSNSDLIALTDYQATSIRIYLGNLRAAQFVVTINGLHHATPAGRARVAGFDRIPIGAALYNRWLGQRPPGEAKILRYAAEHAGAEGVPTRDPVGDAIGLQATSVRIYVGKLVHKKLLVRPTLGRIALSSILRDL